MLDSCVTHTRTKAVGPGEPVLSPRPGGKLEVLACQTSSGAASSLGSCHCHALSFFSLVVSKTKILATGGASQNSDILQVGGGSSSASPSGLVQQEESPPCPWSGGRTQRSASVSREQVPSPLQQGSVACPTQSPPGTALTLQSLRKGLFL